MGEGGFEVGIRQTLDPVLLLPLTGHRPVPTPLGAHFKRRS